MLPLTIVQKIAIWAMPVILAITLHEAAHAFVANRYGDSLAKMLGRMSLNPLRHIDLFGTILVPIFIGIITQFNFVFGWAKPVPINWMNLNNPRRDMALVALAGPVANFIMVFLWALGFKLALIIGPGSSNIARFLLYTSEAGILINLILAFLNLLPIPPLDGSRVVASILPPKQSISYLKSERYGFFILLALLFSGLLGWFLNPLIAYSFLFLKNTFNI